MVVRGSFHKEVTKQHHSVSFQIIKIPKYTFCRGFNSDYELLALLRWRYCDVIYKINVATLPLKSSHKEQPSAIRSLLAKGLGANVIQSEMRPEYGNKYFTRPAMYVWCKSLLMVEKVLMRKNLLAMLFRWPMQRSQGQFPHAVKPACDGINV